MSTMSKRKYKREEKEKQLDVLQQILEKKDILFAKCRSTYSKNHVQREWRAISRLAASYGLIAEPDEIKFRRTTWQNWRRMSLNKIERLRRAETDDSNFNDLLDETDKTILAIVGAEVKTEKLEKPETDDSTFTDLLEEIDKATSVGEEDDICIESCEDETTISPPSPEPSTQTNEKSNEQQVPKASSPKRKRSRKVTRNDLLHLRRELLEVTLYKRRLECRQIEVNLNLPPSSHTVDLCMYEAN